MLRSVVWILFCLTIGSGCVESRPAREPTDRKVKVVAPDVNVDVEPKRDSNSTGKVKVNAPGVHIDVEKKPG